MTIEREALTRKKRIDHALDAAGWPEPPAGVEPLRGAYRKPEIETATGPADYGLYVHRGLVGIVEAKKLTVGPQNVLTQAERYAKGVAGPHETGEYGVPFIYSTNGEVIWFRDLRDPLSRSRQVSKFHTPAALAELLSRDAEQAYIWFRHHPSDHTLLRDYQHQASAAIETAIAEHKRRMLVAMATGTGKTFTVVNEVYRLIKSGQARRVLFLVDRRALAAQAVRAFSAFEAEPGLKFDKIYEVYSQRFAKADLGDHGSTFDPKVLPNSYLTEPEKGHTFVYVSTIQRMAINLFGERARTTSAWKEPDEDAAQLDIPIHAFDVIIADECHRGYSAAEQSIWRETIDHFDGLKIGLTATPAAHSKAYFKDVVFRYSYEEAVRDGYLVDYDVVSLKSDVRMNGVFLRPGEEIGLIDPESGTKQLDLLEDERQFETTEIERKVTSPDSNRKILEELKTYTDEHEERYGRFPKVLIFAANDLPHTSHADQVVDMARDVFGRGDSFVRKITGREDRPLQRIREFRNRPEPGIAVSVDLMTTGVDIPDLEFIVFLRPVRSRILFEQMLGRGTRLGERHVDKDHFTVVDCFDGTLLQYFREATGITAEPPDKPSRTIKQLIEDIYDNRDREYNMRCLVKRLQRIDKHLSGEARRLFAAYVPDGDLGDLARSLPDRIDSDFVGVMKLLRDGGFQDLLENYPRPLRSFLVAYETEDIVSSEWLIRGADGKTYKPDDYIVAFETFVEENAHKIDAIGILLDRPQEWSTDALVGLQEALTSAPQRFTTEHLQKAHQLKYHVALADTISMIKHAANRESPLLTAEERVDVAIAAFSEGQALGEEQQEWLSRIRSHLVENLTVDEDDFKVVPILSRHGGWGRANKAFGGKLREMLEGLNERIAA
ncbi:MAG TPA: DEAD/DEAH box helicase family protein [Acidimicrobiales bacterium]|nr:DEAD/DEAH box helicase family protein [Acidimicrobiales bacterium]